MAEPDNKPSTIDDLVKQLSTTQGGPKPPSSSVSPAMPSSSSMANQPPPLKATASQGPPPNLPGIRVESKPATPLPAQPMPPRPQPSMTSSQPPVSIPKPPVSPPPSMPKPPSPPTASMPPSGPSQPQPPKPFVQEYKSSIRTMGEDISSIKSGQKPLGVDIPRKVTPEMPQPTTLQPKPAVPLPTSPKSIGLGRAEKTGPLPVSPTAPQKPVEMPKPPTIQPSITVPTEKKLNSMFYLLIAGIAVVGGFLYWFLVIRTAEPEVVLSPSPTPVMTVYPTMGKKLNEIFTGDTPVNFEVVSNETLASDFKTFVSTLDVARDDFLQINFVEKTGDIMAPLSFLDLLDKSLALYPAELKDNITDSIFVAYGQSEVFKQDGSMDLTAQNLEKTAFVARISDATAVEILMKDWELTIADDLADFLLIADTSKEASVNFLDNTYRDVPVRYKNFPFADVTIDYAIVNFAGRSYLVISGSRESAYAAIDTLLEQ